MRKLILQGLALLFSLALLFTMMTTSVQAVTDWSPGYFSGEFQKWRVPERFAEYRDEKINLDSLNTVMQQTMLYLEGYRENLIIPVLVNGNETNFYQEQEEAHMAEVKSLFLGGIFGRALSLLLLPALFSLLFILEGWTSLRILMRGYRRCYTVFFFLLLLLGITGYLNFDGVFTLFHEIFFRQGNYVFSPLESRMITMLPEGFFFDTAFRIGGYFLGSSFLLYLLSCIFGGKDIRERKLDHEDFH